MVQNVNKLKFLLLQNLPLLRWQRSKLLGCKLDTQHRFHNTQADKQRRKGLTIPCLAAYNTIFKSKKISLKSKLRTFNAFCASNFQYNSELWTVNKTLEDQIDSFQRRLLRQVINIRWPKKSVMMNYAKKNRIRTMEHHNQETIKLAGSSYAPKK